LAQVVQTGAATQNADRPTQRFRRLVLELRGELRVGQPREGSDEFKSDRRAPLFDELNGAFVARNGVGIIACCETRARCFDARERGFLITLDSRLRR
jgi:hypothetical protein